MKKEEINSKVNYPGEYPVERVNIGVPATRIYHQTILGYLYFGRELKVSPKSNAVLNKVGYKSEFFVETVSVLIGIGDDYTADLVMTKGAWDAFVAGETINIDTVKEFNAKYIKRKRKIKKNEASTNSEV